MRHLARLALTAEAALIGNPASTNTAGRRAKRVLEDARETIADCLGADPSEVIFTSGASEANTIALLGTLRGADPTERDVVVSATEHPSVMGVREHAPATLLPVDVDGVVDLDALAASIETGVAILSVASVNHETGTGQPMDAVVSLARAAGVVVHSDLVQAVGHLPIGFDRSGLDLATVSAHKLGGPVGIGALLVRRGVHLSSVGLGGGQEAGLRSGTQPAALAASFAAALREATTDRPLQALSLGRLRESLCAAVVALIPGSRVNGNGVGNPGICNLTFEGVRADDLLLLLDQQGIDASTGSACRAGVHQPSEVLLAMGRDLAAASGSVRFSFGPSTSEPEIDDLLAVLPQAVARARSAFSVGAGGLGGVERG